MELMQENDRAIIFSGRENLVEVVLSRGGCYRNKWGEFAFADMIGQPFGCKVASRRRTSQKGRGKKGGSSGGWVHVLKPTPPLYTAGAIKHRTQIIYQADISLIIFYLEIKPGSIVVESGTGSGSLSRTIAQTITPTGHLYTYEFHEDRAKLARQDFLNAGYTNITVTHRDVCEGGFDQEDEATAVFLDLPSPWVVIKDAYKALKVGGRFCAFTPSVEQVQKVCDVLRSLGFSEIQTVECRERPYQARSVEVETHDIDFLLPDRPDHMDEEPEEQIEEQTNPEEEQPTIEPEGEPENKQDEQQQQQKQPQEQEL